MATSPASAAGPSDLPITVAVIEDEHEVRSRFELAVRSNARLSLAFSADTAARAMELALARPAQVYLVDLGLPDRDGRELIRWICTQQPEASAMVVTVFGDDTHVVSSFEAGAVGYLLKDTPADEIARCIVELHEGGSPISPSVARHLLRRFMGRETASEDAGHAGQTAPRPDKGVAHETPTIDKLLSEREREVLKLIEKGMTYDEIAEALHISWHTVTTFLRRVYVKLQVNSRAKAVHEARQRGIL
jgi:DNA-binding NarL/FixJ family response regulator